MTVNLIYFESPDGSAGVCRRRCITWCRLLFQVRSVGPGPPGVAVVPAPRGDPAVNRLPARPPRVTGLTEPRHGVEELRRPPLSDRRGRVPELREGRQVRQRSRGEAACPG